MCQACERHVSKEDLKAIEDITGPASSPWIGGSVFSPASSLLPISSLFTKPHRADSSSANSPVYKKKVLKTDTVIVCSDEEKSPTESPVN